MYSEEKIFQEQSLKEMTETWEDKSSGHGKYGHSPLTNKTKQNKKNKTASGVYNWMKWFKTGRTNDADV